MARPFPCQKEPSPWLTTRRPTGRWRHPITRHCGKYRPGHSILGTSGVNASILAHSGPGKEKEPMINILVWYTHGAWQVVMFPRSAGRPREYFADDFERIMVSPAAVELGGLVILPREEDFYKITAVDLNSIFDQVSIQKNEFDKLKERLIQML